MSRQALLRLLHQRIGLDASSLGERVVNDAFAESRKALGVADDEALYGVALVNPQAFCEIVERFVVPESWFFRARDQYDDLVRYASEQRSRRPLRVLSLPCASGEEAYSAVIALLEAGLPPEGIDILGIDISGSAIARAQAGVYRSSALRGKTLPGAWAQPRPGGFSIVASIQRCARFRVGNALDPHLLDASERFDAVFCRNLLIYLHPEARARLLKSLLAALVPGGLLFAGQAEVFDTIDSGLRPYEGGCPLTYQRETGSRPTAREEPAIRRSVVAPVVAAAVAAPQRIAPPEPAPRALSPQQLADAGRLDEARAACRQRLQDRPDDVQLLFLLGLVEAARADLGAADEAFARVCYLDRDHVEAIDHRIALAERQDRPDLARELRQRSQRLRRRLGRSA